MKNFLTTFLLFAAILLSSNTHTLAQTVIFNTKTYKYHSIHCQWALKCTKNCIKIDKKEAIRRGGIPCKVCNGI